MTPADGEVVSIDTAPLSSSVAFADLRAFVAGATGRTGQAIVRRLAAEGIPVRALVRDTSEAVGKLMSAAFPVITKVSAADI